MVEQLPSFHKVPNYMVQIKKITVWKGKSLGLEKLQRTEQTGLEGSAKQQQEQKYIARENG